MSHLGSLEEEIIERIRRRASRHPSPSVRLGIGDDTAVVRPPPAGEDLLFTSDQVIEGTHFTRDLHPPRALGHKSLARALSDIAAMGGRPRYFLLSLCLPPWASGAWLEHYISEMLQLARREKIHLVGGDVARGPHFVADVSVLGSVRRGAALRRGGAKAGDLLYVSGRLGGAALGLQRLQRGEASPRSAAVRRYLYPQPRLGLGVFLRQRVGATAAMDLSDGLSTDLARLARASGVGAVIEAAAVPRFRGVSLALALHGGEDYELLFAVSPSVPVPKHWGKLALTAIGRMRSKPGVFLRTEGATEVLRPEGFQHFHSV